MGWASWLAFSVVLLNFLISLSATVGIAWFGKKSRTFRFPETRSVAISSFLGQVHSWGAVLSLGIVWEWSRCAPWTFWVETFFGFCLWCDFCMARAFMRYRRTDSFVRKRVLHVASATIAIAFNAAIPFAWAFASPPCSRASEIFAAAWTCAFFSFVALVWHRCEYGIAHPTMSECLTPRNAIVAFALTIAPAMFIRVALGDLTWVDHALAAAVGAFHIAATLLLLAPTLSISAKDRVRAILDTNQMVRTPAEILETQYAEKFLTWASRMESMRDAEGNVYVPANYVACLYNLKTYEFKVDSARKAIEDGTWKNPRGGDDEAEVASMEEYVEGLNEDLATMSQIFVGESIANGGTKPIVLSKRERAKIVEASKKPWPNVDEFSLTVRAKVVDFFELAVWNKFVDAALAFANGDDMELADFEAATTPGSGTYAELRPPRSAASWRRRRGGLNLGRRRKKAAPSPSQRQLLVVESPKGEDETSFDDDDDDGGGGGGDDDDDDDEEPMYVEALTNSMVPEAQPEPEPEGTTQESMEE
jgi:hypothetical protein